MQRRATKKELRAALEDVTKHLEALCTERYETRYGPGEPCGGCYHAVANASRLLR